MALKYLIPVVLLVFVATLQTSVLAQSATSAARTVCNRNCGTARSTSEQKCASNGVTYGSECLFQCARARNSRLRVIKSGSCARTSLNEYRRTSGSSSSRNSWFKK